MANLSLILVPNSYEASNNAAGILTYVYSKLCGRNSTFYDPLIMTKLTSVGLDDLDVAAGFCQDSASLNREFIAKFGSELAATCDDEVVKPTPNDCSESEVRV